MAGIDVTALLGKMAAERAALLQALREEGLLEANRALAVPPVIRRIGLVASPDTEGYRDFAEAVRVHVRSPSRWRSPELRSRAPRRPARSPGRSGSAPAPVRTWSWSSAAGAPRRTWWRSTPSRWPVRSPRSPVPVWTGIGHTGDESVADIVANRAFVTPTECGHELAVRLEEWWQRASSPSRRRRSAATRRCWRRPTATWAPARAGSRARPASRSAGTEPDSSTGSKASRGPARDRSTASRRR